MSHFLFLRRGRGTYVPPSDSTPDAFSFTAITGADLTTDYESAEVTLTGMDTEATFSVSGGTLISGGENLGSSGTISANPTVKAKLTSSSSYDTLATATVTIGGVSATFTVTTRSAPSEEVIYPEWLELADAPAPPPTWTTETATVNPSNFDATLVGLSISSPITLYCEGGNYGSKDIRKEFGAMVTLRAADPNNPPIIESTSTSLALRLRGAKNLTLDGWVIRNQSLTLSTQYFVPITLIEPDTSPSLRYPMNIRLTRCRLEGGLDTAVTPNVGLGKAIKMTGAINVQVDRCTFPNTYYGVEVYGFTGQKNTNIYVGYCDFLGNENHSLDSIDVYGVDKMLIEWNQFHERHHYPPGLHPDTIQFGDWSGQGGGHADDETASNVVIRYNCAAFTDATVWTDGTFLPVQTGWFADGYSAVSYTKWVIHGNKSWGGSYHAFSFGANASKIRIWNNDNRPSNRANYLDGGGTRITPWIATTTGNPVVDDIEIIGNTTSVIQLGSNTTNFVVTDNVTGIAEVSDAEIIAMKDAWLLDRAAAGA